VSLKFETAPYGRLKEIAQIFARFDAGKNLLMTGPRRLGKTFTLERIEAHAKQYAYTVIRFDVSPARAPKDFFRRLFEAISRQRGDKDTMMSLLQQRLRQFLKPSTEPTGSWFGQLIDMDWETCADHLIAQLAETQTEKWAILIDELPVFLLHLQETDEGLRQAKSFVYRLRELRERAPQVRWLFTGSIGLEPLARRGEYLGAFNNMEPFALDPLTDEAAQALVKDWATNGLLPDRASVSDMEAVLVSQLVGWRSAYYLEAFAKQIRGNPATTLDEARQRVLDAQVMLLLPANRNYFESWPEHLRKNYIEPQRGHLFKVLELMAETENSTTESAIALNFLANQLDNKAVRRLLIALEEDGFIFVIEDAGEQRASFLMPLLRLWWRKYLPD
jgi:uncharacterized protein